jgi:antitoxin CcdA
MLKESRARFRPDEDRKRPTNISLSAALVDEAKNLGINLSQACEEGLRAATKAERERRWKEDNAEAIQSYNKWIAEHGNPLAKYRMF